jgi:ribonuclease P protein component
LHVVVRRAVIASLSASRAKTPPPMVLRPLKGVGTFSDVLRSGRRTTSGPLSLTACLRADDTPHEPLLVGVSIGRRTARRAVVRNRVKRLLREALREAVRTRAEALGGSRIGTLVLVWRAEPDGVRSIHLRDVVPHVEAALDHAITVCARTA